MPEVICDVRHRFALGRLNFAARNERSRNTRFSSQTGYSKCRTTENGSEEPLVVSSVNDDTQQGKVRSVCGNHLISNNHEFHKLLGVIRNLR
jgi:hypothetical protein